MGDLKEQTLGLLSLPAESSMQGLSKLSDLSRAFTATGFPESTCGVTHYRINASLNAHHMRNTHRTPAPLPCAEL